MRPRLGPQDRNTAVLQVLQFHPMSSAEIGRAIGISPKLARRALAELRISGQAEKIGRGNISLWAVSQQTDVSQPEIQPEDLLDVGFKHLHIPAGEWSVDLPAGAVVSVFDLGAKWD